MNKKILFQVYVGFKIHGKVYIGPPSRIKTDPTTNIPKFWMWIAIGLAAVLLFTLVIIFSLLLHHCHYKSGKENKERVTLKENEKRNEPTGKIFLYTVSNTEIEKSWIFFCLTQFSPVLRFIQKPVI